MWKRLKITSSNPNPDLWISLAGDRRLPVQITRRPQARRMTLRLARNGEAVALTLPKHVSDRKAMDWVATKTSWIEGQLAARPAGETIAPGMRFDMAGETLTLEWSPALPRAIRRVEGGIQMGGPREQVQARLIRWMKAEAKQLLSEETMHYAEKAGVSVERVGVGDPVSRWGSCSSSGTIRYSWRLILAPRNVLEATVAHEVAHRVHMNHSPKFHALVAQLLGRDPSMERKWLRRNAARLHGFGSVG